MKLYNKVFGAFYSLLSVCYLNASEPSSSTWESLSRDASPAEFSKIQEFVAAPSLKIKIIDVNTITSWVRTKSPERFSEFETKFGGPEFLIANPSKVAEIFKNGQKQYLEKTKEGFFEDGSHYIEIQGIQPDKLNLCNIELNGYIDDIAKTEFGRKVLTTYYLCKYCLKDNSADTPILSVLIAEDECAVTKGGNDLYLKFDLHNAKEKISQIRGNFISAENRSLDVLPFSVEECLCHEFIHMIHDMLNIRDTQCFDKESIEHLPLFKELFINGFETIKETANEVLELIYQDKCGFFDILEQEINKFKRDKKYNAYFSSCEYFALLSRCQSEKRFDDSVKNAFCEFIADYLFILQFENNEETNTISGIALKDNVLYISELHEKPLDEGVIRFDHQAFYGNEGTDSFDCSKYMVIKNFMNKLAKVATENLNLTKVDQRRFWGDPALFKINSPSQIAIEFLLRLKDIFR